MRLWRDDSGQGMAEFVLVLPLLALLTFGTIEVAIYLQQQSTLTAAAFLASRSASVLGNEAGPTKASTQSFAAETGAGWLQDAVGGMKASHSDKSSSFKLEAKTDRLSGLIDALTNGQAKGFDTLTAQATLPLEYDHKRVGQRSATSVAKTHFMINYDSKPTAIAALNLALTNIDRVLGKFKKIPAVLELPYDFRPKPKGPGVAPGESWPQPEATRRPQPRPSGHTPAPTPRPVPTPTPRPTPAPLQHAVAKITLPGLAELHAFTPNGGKEPFRKNTAVIPNPHARNDSNDGDQFTSSQYLEPGYENRKDSNYKLDNMVQELGEYDPRGLMKASHDFGEIRVDYPPGMTTVPEPELIAAWQLFARPALGLTRTATRQWSLAIAKGAKDEYKAREAKEREVFHK
ncbi:MAG: hypothetical protein JWM80_2590 [Cyanobacteria bacterium RYN_339]|nr:hypothetical protein [Cyanobacteria bacterium RYN_339]